MNRLDWPPIIDRAAKIVTGYDTGVTLRQLFYRLLSAGLIPNTTSAYKRLSELTAEARRAGTFPQLLDRTRTIHRDPTFDGPEDAQEWLATIYRRDRTEGQEWAVYLGVEKHGIVEQLRRWFGDYGVPIVALGGYSSQTYLDEIAEDAAEDGRQAVLLYAGDWDPSGEDIYRDFGERCPAFERTVRVALTSEQVAEYHLPKMAGKATDSRSAGFVAKHGELVQVEIDALPPEVLNELYADAFMPFMDTRPRSRK